MKSKNAVYGDVYLTAHVFLIFQGSCFCGAFYCFLNDLSVKNRSLFNFYKKKITGQFEL